MIEMNQGIMLQIKSKDNKIIAVLVISAICTKAKEKLGENPKYLFRFYFEYRTKSKSEVIKSIKVQLSEGVMKFADNIICFNIFDKENDTLGIKMAVGNNTIASKFKPSFFKIGDLKMNEEITVTWQLYASSEITLQYKIYNPQEEKKQFEHSISAIGQPSTDIKQPPQLRSYVTFAPDAKTSNYMSNPCPVIITSISSTDSPVTTTPTNTSLPVARGSSFLKNRIGFFESKNSSERSDIRKISISCEKDDDCKSVISEIPRDSKLSFASIYSHDFDSIKLPKEGTLTLSSRNSAFISNAILLKDVDIVLESTEKTILEKEEGQDSFCEGFFICSFPFENAKPIENSSSTLGPCGHSECGMLPALQPEIMARFPLKDTKSLELNNLAATICFPSGVKVCYYEDEQSKIAVKNYSTPITNQQGERYYMMTYHYYNRMQNTDYVKMYTIHPLRALLMRIAQENMNTTNLDKKKKQKIENELAFCEELGFKDIVYVPFCACLISRYPYIRQMEKCLDAIVRMSSDKSRTVDEVYQLILFLNKGIPIPSLNAKLKFYIPYSASPIEIIGPVYQDVNLINTNLRNLLDLFSIENIIIIFRLMLFEQKILFVDAEYNRLSDVTDSFISLLYPFQWPHTYIPIMSDQMTMYLQTFMPFINGINESLMPKAIPVLNEAESVVYVVYIKKNLIDMSSNSNTTGKKKNIQEYLTAIPELPEDLNKKLTSTLKEMKKYLDKKGNNLKNVSKYAVDMFIRNAFVNVFVEILDDYKSYLCFIEEYSVFNTEMLIENRPEKDSKFYQELAETQLFQQFIQNIDKETYIYFNQMMNQKEKKKGRRARKRSNSITGRRTSQKMAMIESLIEKNNTNTNDDAMSVYSASSGNITSLSDFQKKYFTIDKIYVINPNLTKEVNSLNEIFESEVPLNENGVLKETNRIFDDMKLPNLENAPKVYQRYTIPGQISEMKTPINTSAPVPEIKFTTSNKLLSKITMFEQKSKEILGINQKILCKKKDAILTDKEKESIKEVIKDIMGRIFQSDTKNESDVQTIIQMIEGSFGRDYFSSIISQAKVKEKHTKTLSPEGFEWLLKILFNALLEILKLDENPQNLNNAVLMTKGSFLYCKLTSDKEQFSLYEGLVVKLVQYSIWVKDSFWAKWVEMDMKEVTESANESITLTNQDETYYNVMLETVVKMHMLKISGEYIIKCILGLANKKIKNVDMIEALKADINKVVSD